MINVMDFGAIGDGVADDTAAVQAAFNALTEGEELRFTRRHLVNSVALSVSHVTLSGKGGLIKDPDGDLSPMVLLADGVKNVTVRGLRFKGNRQSFEDGQPVPAVLGHCNEDILFEDCEFTDLCDSGIKLRQVYTLTVENCEFDDLSESGVECRWYENDCRFTTPTPWAARPADAGNVRVSKNRFRRIGRFEDITQGTTLVDGCGMTADNTQTTRIVKDVSFTENKVEDCLRGFFTENHTRPIQGVEVRDNDISGSGASGVYTRAGIGIVGADDFEVTGNNIRNIGNHVAVGTDRQAIIISGSGFPSSNGRVAENDIVDTRTDAVRMQYGINVNQVQNLEIRNNRIHNTSVSGLRINDALCSGITTGGNRGAADEHSWSDTYEGMFEIEQLAANSNGAPFKATGWMADPNVALSSKCAIVGVSYRLTAPIGGGSLQIAPYVGGNPLSSFLVNEGSFSGQYAQRKTSLMGAPMLANLSGFAVRYTTSGNFSGGGGAYVNIVFDRSRKL